MIHLDEPFLTMTWDEEIQAVSMQWKEPLDGESLRRGLLAGLDLVRQKRATKWLGDLRRMGVVPTEDFLWTTDNWFPQAISAGLRWVALVNASKVVVRMATKIVMTKIGDTELTTAYFDSLEGAKSWLKGLG